MWRIRLRKECHDQERLIISSGSHQTLLRWISGSSHEGPWNFGSGIQEIAVSGI